MPFKDPEKQREYTRQWVAKRKSIWFQDKTCVKCGSADSLELDHINPEDKVSHSIWSWSQERREVELSKCQVLCASCHKQKTSSQNTLYGSKVKNSILCDEDVRTIRTKINQGSDYKTLAKQYGVHPDTIRYAHKRGWKRVN